MAVLGFVVPLGICRADRYKNLGRMRTDQRLQTFGGDGI
jgi:hypothetical protein